VRFAAASPEERDMKPRLLRAEPPTDEPLAHDAALAHRAARADLLELELDRIRNERDRLEIELMVARGWVKELAVWLRVADLPANPPRARLSDAEMRKVLSGTIPASGAETRSFAWRGVAVLVGASVALWVILGLLALVALNVFR
jgi:hypothetical protein